MGKTAQVESGLASQQARERLNDALNFFGDPLQRWRDRLTPENCSFIEEYGNGRMALVLHCDCQVIGIEEPNTRGFVHYVSGFSNHTMLVILKAHVMKAHKLQNWDEHLMFVSIAQLVQSPNGCIPTLVGLDTHHQLNDFNGDLLLFQSLIQGVCKTVPRISDWKVSPESGLSPAGNNCLVPHMVERTSQVLDSVTDSERDILNRESGSIYVKAQEICSAFRVMLDSRRVEVTIRKGQQHLVNIRDVLIGPLNLKV